MKKGSEKEESFLYHVPGGKEELFLEVMERNFRRHREGLTRVIAQARQHIQAQLYAVADWLLSQPPLDIMRMNYSDLSELTLVHKATNLLVIFLSVSMFM